MLRAPMASSPATPVSLTAVRGVSVGHWTDLERATGCSVVLGPDGGMRAACAVRGRATGTRELDALNPRHLVDRIDAILLTGGSAYGLGAADGVMRWLRERGRGLPVGPAGVVPIVPTAVVFDLGRSAPSGEPRWPTADDAARACDAAGPDVAEGSVGAGTGCTVGKAAGIQHAMKGGVGRARDAARGARGAGGRGGGGPRRAPRRGDRGGAGPRGPPMSAPRLERALDDLRRRWVPDRRLGVFDVEVAGERLAGCVSSRDALEALRRFAADSGLGDEVRLLPDASVGHDRAAVVDHAIAPPPR